MVQRVNCRIRIGLRGDTLIGTTRELLNLPARRAISVKVNVLASFLLCKNYLACSIKYMYLNLRFCRFFEIFPSKSAKKSRLKEYRYVISSDAGAEV